MRKTKFIGKILSLATVCAISFTPQTTSAGLNLSKSFDNLIDKPYELAAYYLPVVEKALSHAKVPFRAKKLKLERYIYDPQLESSEPVGKLVANLEIERDGIFGQVIKGKGKLNDWNLDYVNKFHFSVLGKGTMDVQSKINGENFINLEVKANKIKSKSVVEGNLLDKKIEYVNKKSTIEGFLGEYPYKVKLESIKNEDGDVVTIKSSGSIGEHKIEGVGIKKSDNLYEINEQYGPLVIKTKVTILG